MTRERIAYASVAVQRDKRGRSIAYSVVSVGGDVIAYLRVAERPGLRWRDQLRRAQALLDNMAQVEGTNRGTEDPSTNGEAEANDPAA